MEGGEGGHRRAGMNEKTMGRWRWSEQGKRGTGIWEVTVNTHARHYHHTINTVRHKHRRDARGRTETKTREKQGGGGGHEVGGRETDKSHRVPTFFFHQKKKHTARLFPADFVDKVLCLERWMYFKKNRIQCWRQVSSHS